jgi:aerobic-type carbon monoxide dehydrogenase small subunit (CoxS/CutS family)
MAAFEATVAFEIDGTTHCFATWSDMSALFAVRYLANHDRPRRGCEMGQCGACESIVNGAQTRLCQLPSTSLDGCVITTRHGSVDPLGPESSSAQLLTKRANAATPTTTNNTRSKTGKASPKGQP